MGNRHDHAGQQNLWDKVWRDNKGNIVIFQFPNAPLWAWVVSTCLSFFFHGTVSDILAWIGSAALITWSIWEILGGVNYLRRLLGIIVLGFSIATVIKSI